MPKQDEMNKKTKATTSKGATKPAKPAAKKKAGAPSQYTVKVKPYLADIARYARCGVTEGQICEFYGVGKTQWVQYKKDNSELAEILLKAKQELKTDLINKSYEVAMGYAYEETTTVTYKDKDGTVTGAKTTTHKKYAKSDAGMLQFLLINRYCAEFARDPQAIELRRRALELQASGKIPPDAEGI